MIGTFPPCIVPIVRTVDVSVICSVRVKSIPLLPRMGLTYVLCVMSYTSPIMLQVRNLELLKLRFGESNLFFCEVMIKDIADSKRINSHIVSQLKKERPREEVCVCVPTSKLNDCFFNHPLQMLHVCFDMHYSLHAFS